jgi:hypothetical protein
MLSFQNQGGYVWRSKENDPLGKNRVVFISIFKDSSHSLHTQLVGPYLQAALLKGKGVVFPREDGVPAVSAAAVGRMVLW